MPDCQHEWVVFSTALLDHALMLECATCHAFGVVEDPSAGEWGEAFYAPSRPYRWAAAERVHFIAAGSKPHVRRTPGGGYAPSAGWQFRQELAKDDAADPGPE
jgi:hypothetical protein